MQEHATQTSSDPNDPCVFCTRLEQPATLFETPSVYVMPDKFPLLPGHMLLIAKRHARCFGMMDDGVLRELDGAAGRVRRFLGDAYGGPLLGLENGIAGQAVYHAHLHLVPVPMEEMPPEIETHPDVIPFDTWESVRSMLARHGHYRLLEICGKRYVTPGFSPAIEALRRHLAQATGLGVTPKGFVKQTTPRDVRETECRWAEWLEYSGSVAGEAGNESAPTASCRPQSANPQPEEIRP